MNPRKVTRWAEAHRVGFGIAYITGLVLVMSAIMFLWISHNVQATQSAARRQGELVQRKICLTLNELASKAPPSGNPADNPSRAYLQWLHFTLSQLGPDIGCPPSGVP